jgi:uroporphyrinogen-III synthase
MHSTLPRRFIVVFTSAWMAVGVLVNVPKEENDLNNQSMAMSPAKQIKKAACELGIVCRTLTDW